MKATVTMTIGGLNQALKDESKHRCSLNKDRLCNIQARMREREFPQMDCPAQDWCHGSSRLHMALA